MRSDMVARQRWQSVSKAAHSAQAWWPHWNAVLTGRARQTVHSFSFSADGPTAVAVAASEAGGADGLVADTPTGGAGTFTLVQSAVATAPRIEVPSTASEVMFKMSPVFNIISTDSITVQTTQQMRGCLARADSWIAS